MTPGSRGILAIALLAWGCVPQATPSSTPEPSSAQRPAVSAVASKPPSTSRPPATPPATPPPPTAHAPTASPSPSAQVTTSHRDLGCDVLVAAIRPPSEQPPLPPPPNPTIAGPDAQARVALTKASEHLAGLRSYRFTVDVVGTDVAQLTPSSLDFSLDGRLTRANGLALDALMGFRMRETNGTGAAISGSDRLLVGNGYVWAMDDVSGVLEPSPAGPINANLLLLTPEGLAERLVTPFASGYRRTGAERHDGLETVHYRATIGGATAYAAAMHTDAAVAADVWVASDGGYLAAARIAGDNFLVQFDVTRPNDPKNAISLPASPVPDPVRAAEPAVDMRLTYEASTTGDYPSSSELNDIAHTLRVRLDVSNRPLTVTIARRHWIRVTVCNTTQAAADRAWIVARGALTVVPLPVRDYGSTSRRGARSLPKVGASIDSNLQPIAPAARVSPARMHVDPTTGRRGISFMLGNEAAATFRDYATTHKGEYVAIVYDGIVLATMPIAGQALEGKFAFTGDYTEAEARRFAASLYNEPLPVDIKLALEVTFPADER
jgi:SecD-like export protein